MLLLLANGLTVSRGLCGPTVVVLLLGYGNNGACFWLFIYAISTDLIDGALARAANRPNPVGAWLDPICDKLLTDTTWVALWVHGWAPTWITAAMLGRDLLVLAASAYLARSGRVEKPNAAGQISVAFEGVALSVLLFHGPWNGTHWPSVGLALACIALALSAASALGYVVRED